MAASPLNHPQVPENKVERGLAELTHHLSRHENCWLVLGGDTNLNPLFITVSSLQALSYLRRVAVVIAQVFQTQLKTWTLYGKESGPLPFHPQKAGIHI